MKKIFLLIISHAAIGAAGFAAGIYALPILTAPPAPAEAEILEIASRAQFKSEFQRDLAGSDALHWGEGMVSVSQSAVSLMGKLAPGPDYKLYFSPQFVETEDDFNRHKSEMVRVGDVKTFENFLVPVPESIDPAAYNTVVVWCESFGQFITAAKYQ
jgi:hypothetical protein